MSHFEGTGEAQLWVPVGISHGFTWGSLAELTDMLLAFISQEAIERLQTWALISFYMNQLAFIRFKCI